MTMPLQSSGHAEDIISWARQRMLRNISPPGTRRGAVIASPSRDKPPYYYCWVRDGALVMDAVLSLYARATDPQEKSLYRTKLEEYVEFSRFTQTTPGKPTDLGEPKFHVDGTAFTAPWGRPQNDGPALRAITLIRFAHHLLDAGDEAYVLENLYSAVLPPQSVIKADLEYVSHHWRDPCFDYWEEERATHFATRMAQRRALLDGAELAQRLNDPKAAPWYRQQAAFIGAELELHWDVDARYLRQSIIHVGGYDYKTSGLDVAVILGALHANVPGRSFSVSDDFMLATAVRLKQAFAGLYPINDPRRGTPGLAIGRYPEDCYNGYTTTAQGNPWFLATNAFAEYCYRVAKALEARGEIRLTEPNLPFFEALLPDLDAAGLSVGARLRQGDAVFGAVLTKLSHEGDDFIRRTLTHAGDDSLSEQFDRNDGLMTAAPDLTWSYASLISALLQRPVRDATPQARMTQAG
ncbi:MAG: glycoside hydrolase family 15 protein [Planctomycetota bacterium]|jgi:glucoamylase